MNQIIEDWGIFFSNLSNNNNGMKKTVNKYVWLIKMMKSKNEQVIVMAGYPGSLALC